MTTKHLIKNARTLTASAVLLGAGGMASAALTTITWLDMSPTPFNSPVPNNSNYFVPGIGNVNVTYSIPSDFVHGRITNPTLQNGSITSGPNTWNWGAHEQLAATLASGPNPLVPVAWSVTYTFPAQAAGDVYVGISGLGATTSFGGGTSTATVNQNGTFVGDWISGNNWGATQFTPGAGTFSMQNSVTGLGGADPHWNTELGVVRIDDSLSSLTIHYSTLRGDGVGGNIGFVPAPASAMVMGLAGVAVSRRRR